MRGENGQPVVHAGRDDPNRSAERCARAFAKWWDAQTEAIAAREVLVFEKKLALCAFCAAWQAATGNQGVDELHPRDAREEAQVTRGRSV